MTIKKRLEKLEAQTPKGSGWRSWNGRADWPPEIVFDYLKEALGVAPETRYTNELYEELLDHQIQNLKDGKANGLDADFGPCHMTEAEIDARIAELQQKLDFQPPPGNPAPH